jgi:hypothetical protein
MCHQEFDGRVVAALGREDAGCFKPNQMLTLREDKREKKVLMQAGRSRAPSRRSQIQAELCTVLDIVGYWFILTRGPDVVLNTQEMEK